VGQPYPWLIQFATAADGLEGRFAWGRMESYIPSFARGFPSGVRRRPGDTWRTGRTLSRARELAAVGQGWARTDSERDSTRAGSPPPTAALVRRERTAALLSSAAAGALQRRFNWRAYAWSPSAGGTRARRWLVPAGWRMREGRHGWRSSLTSVQANRQHGLASDGEERRRVRLHAGMDCMLEWIERNSSTLSVRSTEKRTLLLGAPCMHVIKRLQCASNGPRRASPDFLRSHAHLNSPAQHFLSVCD